MAEEKKFPVRLKVKTTIYQGKDKQSMELTTFGTFYKKENADFLQYDEVMEEVGTVATTLKLTSNDAVIMRNGAVKMNLPLQKHKKRIGRYITPYGNFDMETNTSQYNYFLNEQSGTIDLLYDLTMQGQKSGQFLLSIEFKEDKQSE